MYAQPLRSFFLLFSLALTLSRAMGQSGNPAINPALLTKSWPSYWIAPPAVSPKEYGVYHFRRTLDLAKVPDSFVVHVSADNRYQLFVNGELASLGPARGDVNHWPFETVDLTPYLKTGPNVLAAVVWNFAQHAPLAQMTDQTGFIMQGNTAAEADVNTDDRWRVLTNAAYTPIPWGPVAKFENWWYFVVGPTDELDGGRYPWGWQTTGYDDTAWARPRVLARGKPDGVSGDVAWNLVPSAIPPMESRWQNFQAIRRQSGVAAGPGLLTGETPLRVPANTTATILVDQGVLTTAYPRLRVSGGRGSFVQLGYAEALYDSTNRKGNRDDVAGKVLLGHHDKFRTDGGADREFMPLWFRTFRYVQLDIQTGPEPLVIQRLDSRFTAYPFVERARFASNDPTLAKIWEVGWRTARLCANETYVDCPYYEQLQYIGDTRIQALISLYASGDDRLMRNAIQQFSNSRIPEGITQSRYPSELMQLIPTYTLAWVLMVNDYWMHRSDDTFVRSFLPGIRGVFDWYETQLTARGMVRALPYYDFIDSKYPLEEVAAQGGSEGMTVNTLFLAHSLDRAVPLFERFGRPGEAAYYRQWSQKLKQATYRNCYDTKRKLFSDTPGDASPGEASPGKLYFSQQANVMAVLTDALPVAQQPALLERALADTSLIPSETYFQFYNAQALQKTGLGDRYLPSLQPWRNMLAQGLTTFAEWEVDPRSECHAWSASPNYYLLSLVSGILPASPGFKSVRIQPSFGSLTEIESTMPHPKGDIALALKRTGKTGVSGEVTLPNGLTGTFVWNGKTLPLRAGINKIRQP